MSILERRREQPEYSLHNRPFQWLVDQQRVSGVATNQPLMYGWDIEWLMFLRIKALQKSVVKNEAEVDITTVFRFNLV